MRPPFSTFYRFEVVVGDRIVRVTRDCDGSVSADGVLLGSVRRNPAGRGARRFAALLPDGTQVSGGHTAAEAATALAYRTLR